MYLRKRSGSGRWSYTITMANGDQKEFTGFTDKEATKQLAKEREIEQQRIRLGLVDGAEINRRKHSRKPLAAHLADFQAVLAARGNTTKHVADTMHNCRRIVELAGATKFADLTPSRVQRALAEIRNAGLALATVNKHLTSIKTFTKWAADDERANVNLGSLKAFNSATDPRYERRSIGVDELATLIEVAKSAPAWRRVDGETRSLVYWLASYTGLRWSEIRAIKPTSFNWRAGTVSVTAAYTKNRKTSAHRLPPELAKALKAFVKGMAADQPVFNLPRKGGAEMLRVDLPLAGIPHKDERGRNFDFHCLRGQFATMLDDAGVSLAKCQALMRHSTPLLTAKYVRPRQEELDHAISLLPSINERFADPLPITDCPECPELANGVPITKMDEQVGMSVSSLEIQGGGLIDGADGAKVEIGEIPAEWIETASSKFWSGARTSGRPPAGAWIETRACPSRPWARRVAPPAGAWIETRTPKRPSGTPKVAPPAGAWIETAGLETRGPIGIVAPPAGAWIETLWREEVADFYAVSPPLRGRGLKRSAIAPDTGRNPSPPPAGAWIETYPAVAVPPYPAVAPLRGRGLKRRHRRPIRRGPPRRPPPRGRGLKQSRWRSLGKAA